MVQTHTQGALESGLEALALAPNTAEDTGLGSSTGAEAVTRGRQVGAGRGLRLVQTHTQGALGSGLEALALAPNTAEDTGLGNSTGAKAVTRGTAGWGWARAKVGPNAHTRRTLESGLEALVLAPNTAEDTGLGSSTGAKAVTRDGRLGRGTG